jgi:hypothetical protein
VGSEPEEPEPARRGRVGSNPAPFRTTLAELLADQDHVDDDVLGIVPLEISLHDSDRSDLHEGNRCARTGHDLW